MHIVLDASDNVYVNSFIDDRSLPCQVIITKVTSNGTVAWGPKSYKFGAVGASEHMQVGPMALASDGSLYALGRAGQSGNPQPVALFRSIPPPVPRRARIEIFRCPVTSRPA